MLSGIGRACHGKVSVRVEGLVLLARGRLPTASGYPTNEFLRSLTRFLFDYSTTASLIEGSCGFALGGLEIERKYVAIGLYCYPRGWAPVPRYLRRKSHKRGRKTWL